MLTTGGGWQDQAGAPGLAQKPSLRWLPTQLFDRTRASRTILLYYTGLTRLAKNILAEIVRGMFLNSPSHLGVLAEIRANADFASNAVQKCDYDLLAAAVAQTWRLNQRLDAGANPPEVREIFDRIKDYLAAGKLLGAGGGGYAVFFPKDEPAAAKIRQILTENPPNDRARFVDFNLSETGLQVTRS
jgi:galactokinase/mevalonate kinase-like predicted kinase